MLLLGSLAGARTRACLVRALGRRGRARTSRSPDQESFSRAETLSPMPSFDHHIFVCGNVREAGHKRGCCDPDGKEALRGAFKKELKAAGCGTLVRANHAGCLDQCEHGPTVVIYPKGIWYGRV